MKNQNTLEAWIGVGMPDDADSLKKFGITPKMIRQLEKRVMTAIANKMLQRPDVTTFADHRTLQ